MSIDPELADLIAQCRVAEEAMSPEQKAEMRRWQELRFTYGNLACSTNHKPQRKAFYKVFVTSGRFSEKEFNDWADTQAWW